MKVAVLKGIEGAHRVADLPSELEPEDEEAKRFDLLILNLQLAVWRAEPAFKRHFQLQGQLETPV